MRGKRAKILRRAAEIQTVGMPKLRYYDKRTNPMKAGTSRMVHPECSRGAYRLFKRIYKQTRAQL